MKAKPAVRSLFVIVSMLFTCQAHAQTGQFFDDFGASPKSIGMGQAFTAVSDEFSAAYYNPAGLTQLKNSFELTLGYYYAKPLVTADYDPTDPPLIRPGNDLDVSSQPSSHGLILGIGSNLDFPNLIDAYPFFKRFAMGLVFWINLPTFFSYDIGPEPYRPHFLRFDQGFMLMSMVQSFACEITPWFSIGGGIFVGQKSYSSQIAYIAANHSDLLPVPGWTGDEVNGSRVSIQQVAKVFVVPTAGILLKPPAESLRDKISLGLSWRKGQKTHHARGPLDATLGIEDPTGEPTNLAWPVLDVTLSAIVGYQPTQATAALAFKDWPFVDGLTLAFDLTWKDWSKFVDWDDKNPDPRFVDTWNPRFGVDYAFDPNFSRVFLRRIERIALRGGYFLEVTPITSSDKSHNILDTDMDVISGGFQFDFYTRQGRIHHSFEAYGQVHLLRERYIANDQDDIFGPITASGQVWHAGCSITTRF